MSNGAEKQRSAALAARPGYFSWPPQGLGPGGLPAGGLIRRPKSNGKASRKPVESSESLVKRPCGR